MFSRQCEEWDNSHIIALVELDMQRMRVHKCTFSCRVKGSGNDCEHWNILQGPLRKLRPSSPCRVLSNFEQFPERKC